MAPENIKKTISVALGVCFSCAVLVSTSVVGLRRIGEKNRRLERMRQILTAAGVQPRDRALDAFFTEQVRTLALDTENGRVSRPDWLPASINIMDFNMKESLMRPGTRRRLQPGTDTAGIKYIPGIIAVYIVRDPAGDSSLVLPVVGKGLWSTMYGFLALDYQRPDIIRGVTFYEHGETPGLGGEIDNPAWQKLWQGKKALDPSGTVIVRIVKGRAADNSENQIDGLSGATLTTRGVDEMIRFWLGDHGYGPLLKKIRQGQVDG